ncbi:PQQ-binding-like beta-propeller repeat protein [Streptomyces sp. NPDC094032]|uniref:outer membrane protein assembly factor BamB family protein n=1 Tax=Streptomyces sp. NPDC094032 TaxID=3155308 RepID=UPI00332501FF
MTAQVNGIPSDGHTRWTGRTGRTRRTLAATAALVALCSLATACSSEAEELTVVWDTPVERKAEPQGNGAWLSGDTLVRSRFDAVRGFDARTGKRSWEYVPPGRSAVCSAVADTDASVLVLTRDADGATPSAKGTPCGTVVAIDTRNGREIWQTPASIPEPGLHRLQPTSTPTSAGGGIAMLIRKGDKKDRLEAVDVRTGKSRWKAALPKDCVPGRTRVAERQVAALLACGGTDNPWGDKVPRDAELHAAAFDPATGALLWSAPLGGRHTVPWDARAEFVSADPVVVAASSSGDSDSGAYYSFGGNARPNPPIDFSGPYGEIAFDQRLIAAADATRLYVVPVHKVRNSRVDAYRLTAFDLATGDVVWGGADDDRLDREAAYHLLLKDGTLTVLTRRQRSSYRAFSVLDAATGERRDVRGFPEGQDAVDTLFAYEDRLIGARYESGTAPSKPFTAYTRP